MSIFNIPTCIITGLIVGHPNACGDCDPCALGWRLVPKPVKLLLAEAVEWREEYSRAVGEHEDASARISSLEAALREAREALSSAYYDYGIGPNEKGRRLTAVDYARLSPEVVDATWDYDQRHLAHKIAKTLVAIDAALNQEPVAQPAQDSGSGRADGWEPIATAPRDGRNILAAFPRPSHHAANPHFEEVAETWWEGDRFSYPLAEVQPTHWRPLPEPPEPDSKTRGGEG